MRNGSKFLYKYEIAFISSDFLGVNMKVFKSSKFINRHETDLHKLKMAKIIISIFNCIYMLIYLHYYNVSNTMQYLYETLSQTSLDNYVFNANNLAQIFRIV